MYNYIQLQDGQVLRIPARNIVLLKMSRQCISDSLFMLRRNYAVLLQRSFQVCCISFWDTKQLVNAWWEQTRILSSAGRRNSFRIKEPVPHVLLARSVYARYLSTGHILKEIVENEADEKRFMRLFPTQESVANIVRNHKTNRTLKRRLIQALADHNSSR